MKSLKKGMVLPDYKYGSLSTTKIQITPPPRFLTFLLKQPSGIFLKPNVQEGDYVLVGTKIAEHPDWNSTPIHSGTSGKVAKITEDFILIESDEADKFESSIRIQNVSPSSSSPDELIDLIRQAGIVDLGGSAEPTHLRLSEARKQKIDTLIINGCESDPFLIADHVLMLNHPAEILKGVELLRMISGAKRAVIVTERNKLEVVELLNSKNYYLKFELIEMVHFPARYPQGSKRALAESVLGKEAGVLIENVATAFAVYEAVYLNKPLYERVVTVAGACLIEPKNIWARFGTKANDLFRSAKGFLRGPGRVVFGGAMTGEAINNLEIPITKKIQGILALPPELIPSQLEEACIRCAKCVDVCPESLIPETLMRAVKKRNHRLADEYHINSCTECGLCAYICPSHIPLVQLIQSGKTQDPYQFLPAADAVISQTQN